MLPIYYSTSLICDPILYAISENKIEHQLEPKIIPESAILEGLMNGSIPIGFISPLSYARTKGDVFLINDFAIYSPHSGKNSLLFFKGSLEHIDHVFYQTQQISGDFERFIANWVLKETFGILPQWHEVPELSLTSKNLEKHEVIFVHGAEAMDLYPDYENYVDLGEEWTLNTRLPLVHQVLAVSKLFAEREALERLRLSRELGLRNLMKISKAYAKNHSQNWDIYFDILTEDYQFYPTVQVWESLSELMSMMFYSNVVDYLPDLKIYQEIT